MKMQCARVALVLLLLAGVTAIELRGNAEPKKKAEPAKAAAKGADPKKKAEPTKDATKAKKDAKPKSDCDEVTAITMEMKKMNCSKPEYMDKHSKMMAKVAGCRAEKAAAATKKAEEKHDPESKKLGDATKLQKQDPMAPGKTHAKTTKAVEAGTKDIDAHGFGHDAGAAKKDGKKDAKKGAKKEDLMKKMPLKAAEQGFEGKKVEHKDGETKTDDWGKEYGHEKKEEPAPVKKSGSVRCGIVVAMLVPVAVLLAQ